MIKCHFKIHTKNMIDISNWLNVYATYNNYQYFPTALD